MALRPSRGVQPFSRRSRLLLRVFLFVFCWAAAASPTPTAGSSLLLHRSSPLRVLAVLPTASPREGFAERRPSLQQLSPLKPREESLVRRTEGAAVAAQASLTQQSPVAEAVGEASWKGALRDSASQVAADGEFRAAEQGASAAEKKTSSELSEVDLQLQVKVRTACGVGVLDKQWNFALSRKARVEEVQLLLQQLLKPAPPPSLLRLIFEGRPLSPEESLETLLRGSAEEAEEKGALLLTLDLPFPPATEDEAEGCLLPLQTENPDVESADRERASLLAAHIAAASAAARVATRLQTEASQLRRKKREALRCQEELLGKRGDRREPLASGLGSKERFSVVLERAVFGEGSLPFQSSEAFSSAAELFLRRLAPPTAAAEEAPPETQQQQQEEEETEEEIEFFPRPPRTLSEWIQQQLRLQLPVCPKTLLKITAGSIALQMLVSHATPVVQTQQQQRQQRLRETLILSAGPLWLVLHWRPILQVQRLGFALLPKGRAWRALRMILPPVYAALLEEQTPEPLEAQLSQERRRRQSELLLQEHKEETKE